VESILSATYATMVVWIDTDDESTPEPMVRWLQALPERTDIASNDQNLWMTLGEVA